MINSYVIRDEYNHAKTEK